MEIRRAEPCDLRGIISLLHQVHDIHSAGRPDIFRRGNRKYTDAQILEIIADDKTPVYVAAEEGKVLGYSFCILEEVVGEPSLVDRRSLYIDDLCVDENVRGRHIGKSLYEYTLEQARLLGCYHVTLNVWCLNEGAMHFYEKCGMSPLKIVMEKIL